jgi:hypothetical protein
MASLPANVAALQPLCSRGGLVARHAVSCWPERVVRTQAEMLISMGQAAFVQNNSLVFFCHIW